MKRPSVINPVWPGELLFEEFMKPNGLTRYRIAKEIGVPAQRIGDIINGKRRVTADTDLRLCKFFGLTEGYWLRAQTEYDLENAKRLIASELSKIVEFKSPAA